MERIHPKKGLEKNEKTFLIILFLLTSIGIVEKFIFQRTFHMIRSFLMFDTHPPGGDNAARSDKVGY